MAAAVALDAVAGAGAAGKRGAGRPVPVSVALVSSPLGLLKVALREGRLVALALPSEERHPANSFWQEPQGQDAAVLAELTRQLGLYFAHLRKHFFLPLAPKGTAFQRRVWAELVRIPYGQVRTYAQVAQALGDRRLARAVGRACGANPLPIVIPCHRVVATGGGLGGYGGGLAVKRLLLELEAGGGRSG